MKLFVFEVFIVSVIHPHILTLQSSCGRVCTLIRDKVNTTNNLSVAGLAIKIVATVNGDDHSQLVRWGEQTRVEERGRERESVEECGRERKREEERGRERKSEEDGGRKRKAEGDRGGVRKSEEERGRVKKREEKR